MAKKKPRITLMCQREGCITVFEVLPSSANQKYCGRECFLTVLHDGNRGSCQDGCTCKKHDRARTEANQEQIAKFRNRGTARVAEKKRLEAMGTLWVGVKTCTRCNRTKSLSEFAVDKKRLTGTLAICKNCVVLKTAKWAKENPEKRQTQSRLRDARERASLTLLGVTPTEGFYNFVQSLPCYVCDDESLGPGGTVDHILALTRGGMDEDFNLAPMCRSHNSSKLNKTMSEWRPDLEAKAMQSNENARVAFGIGVKSWL